ESATPSKLHWKERRSPKAEVAGSSPAEGTAGNANRGGRAHTPRDTQEAQILPPLPAASQGQGGPHKAVLGGSTPPAATDNVYTRGRERASTRRTRLTVASLPSRFLSLCPDQLEQLPACSSCGDRLRASRAPR